MALGLADLDGDMRKEVIFGSGWTLPIRVYALRTAPGVEHQQRLKWVRNVSGDFIEGGFSIIQAQKSYVLAASRDAPYSRGSLNVIDEGGQLHYDPIPGFDVCLNRMALGRFLPDGDLTLVHGSHAYYGAEYGHRITARELSSGKVLWSTELPGDTGFQNHQIVDIDFDGNNEVVAFARREDWSEQVFVLDGATGAVVKSLSGGVFGTIPEEQILLIADDQYSNPSVPSAVTAVDPLGNVLYELPEISFGIRSADDDRFRLINLSYTAGELHYDLYDAATGAKERSLSSSLSLPDYEDVAKYGFFGPPADDLTFNTLADTDGDGYWNALIQVRDFVVDVHLPLEIHPSYDPYAPMAFRDSANGGNVYAGNR